MRVYEGSPRRNYEEALRSIGAALDAETLTSVMLLEIEQGYFATALRFSGDTSWAADTLGHYEPIQLNFNEDAIAVALEQGYERRGRVHEASLYERALRLIGHWMDDAHASRVLLVEQGGSFIVRVMLPTPSETPFTIAEFTPDDLEQLAQQADIARR